MKRSAAYIIMWVALFIIQTSCDDFLREEPRDKIYEEEAFDNLSDLYLNTVATFYNNIVGCRDSQR